MKESVRIAQIFSLVLMIYALPLIVFGIGIPIAAALGWFALQANELIRSWQTKKHLSKKAARRYDQSALMAVVAVAAQLFFYRTSHKAWVVIAIGLIFLIISVRARKVVKH